MAVFFPTVCVLKSVICAGLCLTLLGNVLSMDSSSAFPQPSDFDLYLLVGQSNMAGRGVPTDADRLPVPRILVFDKHDSWASQGEPVHFDKLQAGVGPGFTFARLMADHCPGKTIGLIPCAVGGTGIERWLPGADLFEQAVRRVRLAMPFGRLKGILWHQGEAQSGEKDKASVYASQLLQVAQGFRRALDAPEVPFIAGELGEYLYTRSNGKSPFARLVNEQIDTLPSLLPHSAVVPSHGLKDKGDELHFDADSQREFGKRYFETFIKLTSSSQ